MTKQLKFRAWDKEKGQMVTDFVLVPTSPTWGAFPIESPDEQLQDDLISYEERNGQWPIGFADFDLVDRSNYYGLLNYEVMQWTGMDDKNGKPIFEGDIVVQNCYPYFHDGTANYRGTVEWEFGAWQVVLHCINPNVRGISDGINELLDDDGEGGKNYEVIGNLYENTELISDPKTGN